MTVRDQSQFDVTTTRIAHLMQVAPGVITTPVSAKTLADAIHRLDGQHMPSLAIIGIALAAAGWQRRTTYRTIAGRQKRDRLWWPPEARAPSRGRPRTRPRAPRLRGAERGAFWIA